MKKDVPISGLEITMLTHITKPKHAQVIINQRTLNKISWIIGCNEKTGKQYHKLNGMAMTIETLAVVRQTLIAKIGNCYAHQEDWALSSNQNYFVFQF